MASISSASAPAERRAVPLKSMCSIKWAAPLSSAFSWREPVPTQIPRAAERTPGTRWVGMRTPLGRVTFSYMGRFLVSLCTVCFQDTRYSAKCQQERNGGRVKITRPPEHVPGHLLGKGDVVEGKGGVRAVAVVFNAVQLQ